jgi:N-acetylmuramoyl-L-alanine amidase
MRFSKRPILTLALFIAFFAALNSLPSAAEAASRASVTEIRHWSNPNYTRVVIDIDRKSTYTYRLLRKDPSINKPRRLYIDIKNAVLSSAVNKSVPIYDGLLKRTRAGQYNRSTVRVVLDIESLEDYKIFPLSDPFRIVVDVSGEASAATGPKKPLPPGKVTRTPSRAPPLSTATKAPVIVIDAGHGGRDPGAIGRRGLREKNITLKISRMLKQRIERETKARVVLTRTRDVYLPLEERTAIANSKNADLFISVHVNASPRRRASGIETYILNLTNDEESRRLAARENATSKKALGDLEFILNDLIKTAKTNDSIRLASSVQTNLVKSLRRRYRNVNSNGVKGAPFYVLVGTRMPSILVEVSFISNPTEAKRLKDPKYLEKVVEGISEGVVKYINGAGLV